MRSLAAAVLLSAALPWPGAAQVAPTPAGTARVPARLSLDEAVRLAESGSPVLLEARARVAMAEAEAVGAPKRPNPSLDLEFRGYPLFESDVPPFLDSQELTIAIDQEFEPGDRRRWRQEAAQFGVQASVADSLDAMRRLRIGEQRAEADAGLQHALRIPPFSLGGGWQRDFGTNAVVVRATIPLALWKRLNGTRGLQSPGRSP